MIPYLGKNKMTPPAPPPYTTWHHNPTYNLNKDNVGRFFAAGFFHGSFSPTKALIFPAAKTGVHSHAPSIRSHRGIKVVWPDFQPMRVAEEPVCVHLFRQKPVFTSLHLKSPVRVHRYRICSKKFADTFSASLKPERNLYILGND